MRAKKHITPIDMEIIYRAHKSVWTALKHENSSVAPMKFMS